MIRVKAIDHVAIAVADLPAAASRIAGLFGLRAGAIERVASQETLVQFLHAGDGGAAIEVIAPDGNPGLRKFLDRRGQGLHHVCFQVDDIEGALRQLKAAGVALIDETARPGARGHRVAFIHPGATGGVLFELCETAHG